MAWPQTRLTTYNPATKVKSNDLNAFQDAIIGRKHGTITKQIAGALFVQKNTAATVTYDNSATLLSSGANPANVIAPLVVPIGTSIIGVRFYVRDNVTGATKWTVTAGKSTLYDALAASINSGGPLVSAGTGADQTLALVFATPYTLAANERLWLAAQMTTGTAACKLYGVEVDIAKL